ncbi:MAG TPA: ubiquitin-conjugating enzyme E2 [Rubrivivax sp.]|nr:ubiquitin-conjugating enzyme E2 [Rubrivivax sp.]
MNALETRRREDLARVKDLCDRSGGRIRLVSADGDAPTTIKLKLNYRTAGGTSFPEQDLTSVEMKIQIPAGYPFRSPPVATLSPVVYHPNVYASGQVCLGSKWVVSEFLDLLVKRVVRIISYQEDVLNEASPANGAAVSWYRERKRRFPKAFPTDTADTVGVPKSSGLQWNNLK